MKIETISFTINSALKPNSTTVYSYINNTVRTVDQDYITDPAYPYWLLYRDTIFDGVASMMKLGIFKAYRDRVITKSITKPHGATRVLKSRNIGNNEIINIPDYDSYVDNANAFDVSKFIDCTNCVLIPNLTYNPRACFLPKGCIADGSIAILTLIDSNETVTKDDLSFYASEQFSKFYAIARNLGSRSLNIDNNSVFFFGKLIHTIS